MGAILGLTVGGPELPEKYAGTMSITPDSVRPGDTITVAFPRSKLATKSLVLRRYDGRDLSDVGFLMDEIDFVQVNGTIGYPTPPRLDSYELTIPRNALPGTYLACELPARACALLTIN